MTAVGVGTSVAQWLARDVVAPDLYSRAADKLRQRSEATALRTDVRKRTGIRPGRGFRRWYSTDATWELLASPSPRSYEALVDTLVTQRSRGWFGSSDRNDAVALVDAAIDAFMRHLDPSLAVQVADRRQEERHQELTSRLDASSDFRSNLARIPPVPRAALETAGSVEAERLAAVAAGENPRQDLHALLSVPPGWLTASSAEVTLAAGLLAQAYGLRPEAARLLGAAGNAGLDRGTNLARASFEYHLGGDEVAANEAMETAREVAPEDALVRLGVAYLSHEPLTADQATEVLDEPLAGQIVAADLLEQEEFAASLGVLEALHERHPDNAGIRVNLARNLLARAARGETHDRTEDRRRALDLALGARNLRREWRMSAVDAVQMACIASISLGDLDGVIQLGAEAPLGEATPDEGSDPDIAGYVVDALLAKGDHDAASEIVQADAADAGRTFAYAEVLAATGAESSVVAEAFGRAWIHAAEEHERAQVWLGAAMAGVDPVPGHEELAARDDELPDLVSAHQQLAAGRPEEAVHLLRPHRDDEPCSRVLAHSYLALGRADLARQELEQAAERFDNPRLLVDAVGMLIATENLDAAAEVAQNALSVVPTHLLDLRSSLRQARSLIAGERREWHDMARQVRAWMGESGVTPARRWLLVQALFNQGTRAEAWSALRDHPPLVPGHAGQAQLWIALQASENPRADSLPEFRRLIATFRDEPEVARVAIGAYLSMDLDGETITSEERDAWREIIEANSGAPGDSDALLSTVAVPDDLAGLTEAMRPHLEPAARRNEEIERLARSGAPIGLVAALLSRPYTALLTHRALGWLPIARADPTQTEVERAAAVAAAGEGAVLDISALATCFVLDAHWPLLQSYFSHLETSSHARHDIAAAVAGLSPRPSGWLSWDVETGRPVFNEATPETLERVERQTEWMEEVVSTMALRDVSEVTIEQLADLDADRHLPWLAQLELAYQRGLPLWADDVGLRDLARQLGVDAFGTTDLIQVLAPTQSASWAHDAEDALFAGYYVDLPLDVPRLIQSAEDHGWLGGPAAANMARPAMWRDLSTSMQAWDAIAKGAADEDPSLVARWVFAAALGIGKLYRPDIALGLTVSLVGKGTALAGLTPERFAECLGAGQEACASLGLPNPGERVLSHMYRLYVQKLGPAGGASAMTHLGDLLRGDDREVLRDLIWERPPPTGEAAPENVEDDAG